MDRTLVGDQVDAGSSAILSLTTLLQGDVARVGLSMMLTHVVARVRLDDLITLRLE